MPKAPKIGSFIPVKKSGRYVGQLNTNRTGEVLRSVETTTEEKVVFHSSNFPLHEFRAQETCFYEGYCVAGYVYALRIPPGTEIRRYRGGEVRIDLRPDMEIRYLGRMVSQYVPIRPSLCREVVRYSGLVKKYLQQYGHSTR